MTIAMKPKRRTKAAVKAKAGRPPLYTKELAEEICEQVAMRVSLSRICQLPNMPAERTVYR
jgi:hypothetical protein